MGCKKCGASVRTLPPEFEWSANDAPANEPKAEIQMRRYINGLVAGQDVELYAASLYILRFSFLRALPQDSFSFRKNSDRDLYNASV